MVVTAEGVHGRERGPQAADGMHLVPRHVPCSRTAAASTQHPHTLAKGTKRMISSVAPLLEKQTSRSCGAGGHTESTPRVGAQAGVGVAFEHRQTASTQHTQHTTPSHDSAPVPR